MKVYNCLICGKNSLIEEKETYICSNCNSIMKKDEYEQDINKIKNELVNTIGEIVNKEIINKKEDEIANLRCNMYEAINQKYPSNEDIINYALKVKSLLPNDPLANFFSNINNIQKLSEFLHKEDFSKLHNVQIDLIMKFLISSPKLLIKDIPLLVSEILENNYNKADIRWQTMYTNFVNQMKLVNNGFFDVSMSRDVFVAYSSKDKQKVLEVVEFLEKNGFSCFLASRNLQHGSGSMDNYNKDLQVAIDNCSIFLLISSTNSRTRNCDALSVEMQYIHDKDLSLLPSEMRNIPYSKIDYKYKKYRVEYIIEDYNNENILGETKCKEFFANLERVYDKMELLKRIDNILNKNINLVTNEEKVKNTNLSVKKYCVNCLTENMQNAKYCIKCNRDEFAQSSEQAFKIYQDKQIQIIKNNYNRNDFLKVGDSVFLGKYKNSSIEWKIQNILDGNVLLVSKYIIDTKIFSKTNSVVWENSEIRKWLNNEFYIEVFSNEEKENIINNFTNDRVFLLSREEVEKYLSNNDRLKKGTEYAINNGLTIANNEDYSDEIIKNYKDNGLWWLRTLRDNIYAELIDVDGNISYDNSYEITRGIVPAIIVKLDTIKKNKLNIETIIKNADNGDIVKFGKYKSAPLEWEVRKNIKDKVFLVSKNVLCEKNFDKNTNNWEYSELREWANGEFYNECFTENEKKLIKDYTHKDTQVSTIIEGKIFKKKKYLISEKMVSDKVFVLSKEEIEKLYPDIKTRRKEGTQYARDNKLYVWSNGYSFWWLRSVSDILSLYHVDYDGNVIEALFPNATTFGFVPSIII